MINPVNNLPYIQKTSKIMAGVADKVSKGFDQDFDLNIEKEFSKSIASEHNISANTKVIQAHDDMLGSIIDIYV